MTDADASRFVPAEDHRLSVIDVTSCYRAVVHDRCDARTLAQSASVVDEECPPAVPSHDDATNPTG
ncbi:hypothetical protein [Paeniglutamicibacter sp. NPDC091659]|uniref:hypothetical protein n=1 Tax=Paeniglutamicibacter sp. NPDC091659 TaxID=3364389 RepID=UPI0038304F0A